MEVEFVNSLRERVKNYFADNNISKFGNANMVIKTIFMFLLFFGPYFAMVTGAVTNPWLIILGWILMGFGMAGIGLSVMHDANHKSYSKNQKINKLLSYSLNLVGGFVQNWQHQHNNLHHSFTNIEGHDEDIDPGAILRFSPNAPLKKHHRFQHLYAWFLYGLMTLSWSISKDFKQLIGYLKEGVSFGKNMTSGRLISELVISKILFYSYILVIPLLFLPIAWWAIVLLYLLMHFISGFTLALIFQTAHVMPSTKFPMPDDSGNIENNWAIHQLMTTTNYAPESRAFSWFIGGLNYQVEHHLFPMICHVHYHKISAIVRDTAQEYNLPYNVSPTFIAALKQHYEMLKYLGRTPTPTV
ncbi:MAG: acyl-CoA desaturase [Bacteroidales bacterium]